MESPDTAKATPTRTQELRAVVESVSPGALTTGRVLCRAVVGVIRDRNIVLRHVAEAHHHDCAVREHMTSNPLVTVRPGAGADDVMKKMRRWKVRRVMVTDGEGILQGVIAQADIVREEGEDHPRRVEKMLDEISEPVGLPR